MDNDVSDDGKVRLGAFLLALDDHDRTRSSVPSSRFFFSRKKKRSTEAVERWGQGLSRLIGFNRPQKTGSR